MYTRVPIVSRCSFLFFSASSTCVMDTRVHPLSLRDTLPGSAAQTAYGIAAGLGLEEGVLAVDGHGTTLVRPGDGELPLGALSGPGEELRSEEHTSELQSLMRILYAVFCLNKHITSTT